MSKKLSIKFSEVGEKRTPEVRETVLEELGRLTRFELEELTTVEARSKLRALGVTMLNTNEGSVPVGSAKKRFVVDALWEAGADRRFRLTMEASGLSPDSLEVDTDGEMVSDDVKNKIAGIVTELLKYVEDLWDTESQGWKMAGGLPDMLGKDLWFWLSMYRGHTGELITIGTRMSYASKIIKSVESHLMEETVAMRRDKLKEAFNQFRTAFNKQNSVNKSIVAKAAKQREDFRLDHVQQVDVSRFIERADRILRSIMGEKKPRWIDVSIALALVTGRRMSEIHATGSFTLVDETHVRFTGQLKKKDEYEGYVIPTLVPAKLVILGHEYIKALEKYTEGQPKLAHTRYSKDISCRGMGVWYTECMPELKNYRDENGKEVGVRTYHRLRELYALMCVRVYGPIEPSAHELITFYKSILGHAETGNQFLAYERNFKIVGGIDRVKSILGLE